MDMDEMQAGIDNDAEARRIAALIDEVVDTDEQKRERMAATVRKTTQSTKWCEAHAKAIAKRSQDPIYREAMSKLGAKRAKDPVWREGNAKIAAKRAIQIYCIETNMIYQGANAASRKTGTSQSDITKVCKGYRITAGGYHWRYATPEEVEKFRSQSVPGTD